MTPDPILDAFRTIGKNYLAHLQLVKEGKQNPSPYVYDRYESRILQELQSLYMAGWLKGACREEIKTKKHWQELTEL